MKEEVSEETVMFRHIRVMNRPRRKEEVGEERTMFCHIKVNGMNRVRNGYEYIV